ncbi:uncharacterized protein LOC109838264 [Asparagus officinalis]|uniref:uncharacterized protein LOC109838264 n=1 Tax=Asparagus officinalis TaxID=4686 RepID=UPI00098E3B9C|nr:uncharacterized protein LOC109838264 [Asparagus officinalis]
MNFDVGGPSYLSSSSSSDDDNFLTNIIAEIDETEEVICEYINNNMIIANNLRQQNYQPIHGGSIPGHVVINRDRETAHQNLVIDYFIDNPCFGEDMFRRRYRMSRSLFIRIVHAVKDHDHYFQQRSDELGRMGLSPLQKVTAVFRMLAYGLPADATDEYVKIGESTAIESMTSCRAMVEIFAERYLRTPNANDIVRLLYIGKKCGFPGMLGSLDYYDLWIWHAYFGMLGINNDINVLESSNLFSNLAQGIAPPAYYVIQGKEYNMSYYLADGIYPKWATIVQTIQQPQGRKKKYFAMKQEACRKDVERAFGVLQSRFAIVAGSARFWKKYVLHDIMTACIIMHNMIIKDERDLYAPIQEVREAPTPEVDMVADETTRFTQFIARYGKIKDKDAHIALRNALIDHLWEEYTNSDS